MADDKTKKLDLIKEILKENKDFGAVEIVADKRFQKAYPGAKSNSIGILLGQAREALNISNEKKPTASKGGKKKNPTKGMVSLDSIKDVLSFVNAQYGGDFTKAKTELEEIQKLGSVDTILEIIETIEDLNKTRSETA